MAARQRPRSPRKPAPDGFDTAANLQIVREEWSSALPSLQDFVRIPNLTPQFDQAWETNGLLDKASAHVADWFRAQRIEGCTVEVMKDPGFSPFVFTEIAATPGSEKAKSTFLMYGHIDKQPHGVGWAPGIEPTGGLVKDGLLFGRGAVDDGYHAYACGIAVKALQRQGVAHPRIIILSECSEESGSVHLGHYVEKLAPRIGKPSAVFCCDAGGDDYETLWVTTSLRGTLRATVQVGLLKSGQHSGVYGGTVPDAFRVMRLLLARLEDPSTGKIILPELHTKIPVERQSEMRAAADKFGFVSGLAEQLVEGARPQTEDAFEMRVNGAWRPCMAVTGFEGLPPVEKGSPVLHPYVKLMLVMRIPPLIDAEVAVEAVKEALERDPPYGAKLEATVFGYQGWSAPEIKANLRDACEQSCQTYFSGNKMAMNCCGGGIPIVNMLSDMFPEAAMLVTGTLGPGGNMHGPNEALNLEHTTKFTACLAMIMGTLKPDTSWPDDVPRPNSTPAKTPKYCFRMPKLLVGECACCL